MPLPDSYRPLYWSRFVDILTRLRSDRSFGREPAVRSHAGLLSRLIPALAAAWLLIIAILAAINAWVVVGIESSWPDIPRSLVTPEYEQAGVWFNLCVLVVALTVSLAVGLARPSWWRRAVVGLAVVPVSVLLVFSHRLAAAGALLALLLPTCWLGRELAEALLGRVERSVAWVVGGAIGLAVAGALGFTFGQFGLLRPLVVWAVVAIIGMALLVTAPGRLRDDMAALWVWLRRPVTRDPISFTLAGLAIVILWLNLIGALAPETASDAVRQRLVTAARFAETGQLTTGDPDLFVANDPAFGEILYAVVLVLGPTPAAKLLHWLAGLGCAAAVGLLGQRLGGRMAGGVSAVAFYTMPIVGWLSQVAYLDLFTTFFALTAVLTISLRERIDWRVTVLAGVCLGCGIAVKIHFGYVAVGVAVTASILALRQRGLLEALQLGALLAAVTTLTALPWLGRSYLVTGQVPGLTVATQSLTRAAGEAPTAMADLTKFGFERTLPHLLRVPFDVTLRSGHYEWAQTPAGPFGGLVGYLLLGLVPLLIVSWPRLRTLAMLAGALTAFVLWFLTAQYLRYGLPVLALLCPLGGVAYAATRRRLGASGALAAVNPSLLVLLFATVSIPLEMPTLGRQFALGLEDEATYLERYLECCGSYAVLELLAQEPRPARVLAFQDPARLYSSIQMGYSADVVAARDEEELLALLSARGYTHISVDRRMLRKNWDMVLALDDRFLRRNTALVGGGDHNYLYRILPPERRGDGASWGQGDEALANGGFEADARGLPEGWTAVGRPRYDTVGAAAWHGRGAVSLAPGQALRTQVAVRPGARYVLALGARSMDGYGRAKALIHWRNAADEVVGGTFEYVPVSPRSYHTQSILISAPPDAMTAMITLQTAEGDVWFDDVSLRIILPEGAVPERVPREGHERGWPERRYPALWN